MRQHHKELRSLIAVLLMIGLAAAPPLVGAACKGSGCGSIRDLNRAGRAAPAARDCCRAAKRCCTGVCCASRAPEAPLLPPPAKASREIVAGLGIAAGPDLAVSNGPIGPQIVALTGSFMSLALSLQAQHVRIQT